MGYNLHSAKDRTGSDVEAGIVHRTEAGVYSGCEGLVCNWLIDAVADLAYIPACAPSSFAWTPDMVTLLQLKNDGHWDLPDTTPVLFTTQPEDVETTAGSITESLTVACYSMDDAAITYQWYSNNAADYTNPSEVVGETAATMALGEALAAGTYYYFCDATSSGVAVHSDIATVTAAEAEA
jgi:hypothetical protein